MEFKLDENLGVRIAEIFRKEGYDVATVPEQKLCGSPDRTLISVCEQERRCLVTLDLDFANPLVFNPSKYAGIAVLRLPAHSTFEDIQKLVWTLLKALKNKNIEGKLWIVQLGRIREYQPEGEMN